MVRYTFGEVDPATHDEEVMAAWLSDIEARVDWDRKDWQTFRAELNKHIDRLKQIPWLTGITTASVVELIAVASLVLTNSVEPFLGGALVVTTAAEIIISIFVKELKIDANSTKGRELLRRLSYQYGIDISEIHPDTPAYDSAVVLTKLHQAVHVHVLHRKRKNDERAPRIAALSDQTEVGQDGPPIDPSEAVRPLKKKR